MAHNICIWLTCSADLNPCGFLFWACLTDKLYKCNLWTEELKENICKEIANIPAEQFQRVNQNSFCQREKCLRVEGQHFQHLLWSVNCNYFIPNVICQQAYWITGKIRMRLGANRAPVTVKRRACTGQLK
jgi:hypothetical protein